MSVSIASGVSATPATFSTAVPTVLSPTASPMTITNTFNTNIDIVVSGGTVSLIEFSRDGISWIVCGLIAGMFGLNPNDKLRVSYAVAPTLTRILR